MAINNKNPAEKLNESEPKPSWFNYVWHELWKDHIVLEGIPPTTLVQKVQEVSQCQVNLACGINLLVTLCFLLLLYLFIYLFYFSFSLSLLLLYLFFSLSLLVSGLTAGITLPKQILWALIRCSRREQIPNYQLSKLKQSKYCCLKEQSEFMHWIGIYCRDITLKKLISGIWMNVCRNLK